MAIQYKPDDGTLLICDFRGAVPPEMNKKRPVVVLASVAYRLCVVVPLSTTTPAHQKDWHYLLHTPSPLPAPYDATSHWAKCDMVCTISFDRLQIPCLGRDRNNKRIYEIKKVSPGDLNDLRRCVAKVISFALPD